MNTVGMRLVEGLHARGVEVVFGIPGVHTVEMYRGLSGSPVRHVTARHEQGCAFMADGYARATGKPGVALVITGPGRPVVIAAKAQSRVSATCDGSVMRRVGQSVAIIACWSGNSCNRPQPLPKDPRRLTPEITSIGIESSRAWAMAVMALVRPGPVITKATPGLPVARA